MPCPSASQDGDAVSQDRKAADPARGRAGKGGPRRRGPAPQGGKPAERRKPSHRDGRKRYVAFTLLGRLPPRPELESLIGRSCSGRCRFKLTYYEGQSAVVRCIDRERDAIVAAINGLSGTDPTVQARTLSTSGTIRKAKEAFQPA